MYDSPRFSGNVKMHLSGPRVSVKHRIPDVPRDWERENMNLNGKQYRLDSW